MRQLTDRLAGPTHDDITYQSLAKAFDPEGKLVYDEETMKRMTAHLDARKARGELKDEPTEDALTARKRMALFPEKGAEVLHVQVGTAAHEVDPFDVAYDLADCERMTRRISGCLLFACNTSF